MLYVFPDGSFVPFQLQVLELDGDRVQHVHAFFDASLFAKCGLPATLPAGYEPAELPQPSSSQSLVPQ